MSADIQLTVTSRTSATTKINGMVSDVVPVLTPVSGWAALLRVSTGIALALATSLLLAALGHPMGVFLAPTMLLWSLVALHSHDDRRNRTAAAAAAVTIAAVWLALALPLDGLPGDLAGVLPAALAGSQVYAVITRTAPPA